MSFVSPFTGDVVQPTDVSYLSLTFSTNQQLDWPAFVVPGNGTVVAARIIDCVPQAQNLTIKLPPADQGSVGTDILFRNKSQFPFIVQTFNSGATVQINPGTARYFYLSDNTTPDGVFENFTYGAGVSAADAASLAGRGLTTHEGKLESSSPAIEVTTPPTLNEDSRSQAYVWIGGQGEFQLPDPMTLHVGWTIMVRNGGTGVLTVVPPEGHDIDGKTSVTMYPLDSAMIVNDANTGHYFTVGLTRTSVLSYTAASYDVDNITGNTLNLVTYAPTIQTYLSFSGSRQTQLDVILPAITQVYFISNATGQNSYSLTFKVTGSNEIPVPVSNGTSVILLSDGNTLSILSSQVLEGNFLANNGTVASPSYSFLSDTSTGLFLPEIHRLGISAYGVNMLDIDAVNLGDLKISTPAKFNAALISGGSF